MTYKPTGITPVISISANRTISLAELGSLVVANATSGAIAVTLPPLASSLGKSLVVVKSDSSPNVVVIDGNAAETVGGAATQSLATQNANTTVTATATGWVLVEEPASSGATEVSSVSETVTQVAHGLVVKDAIYHNGSIWVKSQGNVSGTVAQGIVTSFINANTFVVTTHGKVTVTGHGLTVANYYWLSQATAGLLTLTQPTSGIVQSLVHVRDANTLFVTVGQAISI